jgi:hypothetical protein
VVSIRSIRLNIENSALCLHSVFECFLQISQQTAIISLLQYSLVSIAKGSTLFSTRKEEIFHMMQIKFVHFGLPWICRLVAGLSPRQLGVIYQATACQIMGGEQSGTATYFSPSTSVCTFCIIPPVPHTDHCLTRTRQ